MTQTLQMGCIGSGNRGRLYSRLAGGHPGYQMRAYADASLDAANAAMHDFGGDYATTDADKVLQDPNIDAVVISTWNDSHRRLAIAAAENGKHILLEKPLALTVEDALAMEASVKASGVILMIGHKFRFAPVVRAVRELLPQPAFLMGQVMDERWPDESWVSQPDTGGANVLSQGCHIIDLIYSFVNHEPWWVAAAGGRITHPDSPLVDHASALIYYANGAVATAIMGDAGVNPVTSKFFLQLWNADGRGACLYDRCHRARLWGFDRDEIGIEEFSAEDQEDPEGNRAFFQTFIEATQTGRQVAPGVVEGRITTETLEAVIGCIRSKQTHFFSEDATVNGNSEAGA